MALKAVTIKQEWEDFCTDAFRGVNVSEIQRLEMRRAFYAGVASMAGIYYELGANDIPEDEAIRFLETLGDELGAFGEAVSNGKA